MRVASLSSLTQAGSDPTESCDTLSGSVRGNTMLRVRVCHGCHSPIDEGHKGYPTGAEKCPLDHWEDCAGGIPRDNSDWRPCPGSTASEGSENGNGVEDDSYLLDKTTGIDTAPGVLGEAAESEMAAESETAAESERAAAVKSLQIGNAGSEKFVKLDSDTDDEDTLAKLEATFALLKEQKIKQQSEDALREKRERKERIEFLKSENGKLSLAMGGDIGGTKLKVVSKIPPKKVAAASTHPKTKHKHTPTKDVLDKYDVAAGDWQPSFQEHLNRNQLNSAQYRPGEEQIYSGLDINGIRRIPEVRTEVDELINLIKSQVPSLDCRPSHVPGKKLPPPSNHRQMDRPELDVVEEFVYQRRPDGTLVKVKVVGDPVEVTATSEPRYDDHETSGDEDCDVVPPAGYRLRWMRDSTGEKFCVEEKEPEKPPPQMVYKYIKDASGRSYKRLVRVQPKVATPSNATTTRYVDHRSTSANPDPGGPRASHSSDVERRPGFISVSTGPTAEEKQGKGNNPDIVHYARNCPVSWTSKVTSDKINLGLWSWSYVAQLLASRTGQAPTLGRGELEAKMQHFLNVLEIALQPSNPTEFEGHSWRIARLYAEKIQNKVDRGETWTKFDEKYGTDSQPSELMAAREEIGPRPAPRKTTPTVRVKEDDKKDGAKVSRRPCTSWNTSTVEGKCDWEVQNEGKTCDRRHDCTWCKEKGKRSLFHQRTFCRQRLAAGEQ